LYLRPPKSSPKRLAQYKKARAKNPEAAREQQRRWVAANPEKMLEARRAWYRRNKEHAQAKHREWNRANPAKVTDYVVKQRITSPDLMLELVDRRVVFQRDQGLCGICTRPVAEDKFDLDHIVPIKAGGEHSYANVRVTHPICNRSRKRHDP
jgi:5-methylcytosine-specific restriction endonuclease McrA